MNDCDWKPVQNIPLIVVQSLAGNGWHLLLHHKVLGETQVDQSMIQCLVLCVADNAIHVVLRAGERNLHSVGKHVLHLHPVNYIVCDPAVSFCDCTNEAFAGSTLWGATTRMLFDASGEYPSLEPGC